MHRALASRPGPAVVRPAARPAPRAAPAPRLAPARAVATEKKTFVAETIPGADGDAINAIRFLAIDGVNAANSGHPGLPMGCAPMAYVLFKQFLTCDPADPKWPNRDRFVLSAGHGSMLQYALLHLMGYKGMQARRAGRAGGRRGGVGAWLVVAARPPTRRPRPPPD